jgi:thioredoxin-like negative regulator of GroEL
MAANASPHHASQHYRPRLSEAGGQGDRARQDERGRDDRPLLLFFTTRRSGVARRMSSLVAWVSVTEKARLRVIEVDADENETFARALKVSAVPTLLVVRDRRVLARHEGRATGHDIEELIRPHVTRDGAR